MKASVTVSRDEMKERAVDHIEVVLNHLNDFGFKNEELKSLLEQIIVDIDRGFVGEPC